MGKKIFLWYLLLINFNMILGMFTGPEDLLEPEKIGAGRVKCSWCEKTASAVGIIFYRPYDPGSKKVAKESQMTRVFMHYVDSDEGCFVTGIKRSVCYDKKDKGLHRQLIMESNYYKNWHRSWIGERCPRGGCRRLITGIKYVGKSVDHDAAIFLHDGAELAADGGGGSAIDAASSKSAK